VVGGIVSGAAKLRGCACIGKYPGAGREETIRIDPSNGELIGQEVVLPDCGFDLGAGYM
jgi:hypothetical protein